jgi:ornithine cyclodeaminase
MRSLSAADIARLLPMPDAIDISARAFAAISARSGTYPLRTHFPVQVGDALVMPGYDGRDYLGTKIVVVRRAGEGAAGTRACYLLMTASDAQPVLLCDGTALTALRTGAASGLATRRLARKDARVVALFGVGIQAGEQLRAVASTRLVDEVRVVSRDATRAGNFIQRMREALGDVRIARSSAEEAVRNADIVITATNSTTPVFDASWVRPGTHVNAIGSFRPEMRELDSALFRRARVFVDQREAALSEAGELIDAVNRGIVEPERLREIGVAPEFARESDDEITVFKTVGHAALDLFTAAALLERAG